MKVQEPQMQTQTQLLEVETDFTSLSIAPTDDATNEVGNYLQKEKGSEAIIVRQKNTLDEKNNQILPTAHIKLKSSISSQLKTRNSKHINKQQKFPSSNIPQLNRTFYFGMSSGSTQASATVEASVPVAETLCQKGELILAKNVPMHKYSENLVASTTATAGELVSDITSDTCIHRPQTYYR